MKARSPPGWDLTRVLRHSSSIDSQPFTSLSSLPPRSLTLVPFPPPTVTLGSLLEFLVFLSSCHQQLHSAAAELTPIPWSSTLWTLLDPSFFLKRPRVVAPAPFLIPPPGAQPQTGIILWKTFDNPPGTIQPNESLWAFIETVHGTGVHPLPLPGCCFSSWAMLLFFSLAGITLECIDGGLACHQERKPVESDPKSNRDFTKLIRILSNSLLSSEVIPVWQ